MRGALVLVLLLLLVPSSAPAQERYPVPPGVRFTPPPAKVERAVQQKLERAFGKGGDRFGAKGLLSDPVVIGPALWKQLAASAALFDTVGSVLEFHLPNPDGSRIVRPGRRYKGDEVPLLVHAMRQVPKAGEAVTVRSPTRDELTIYWAMVPFDLVGPLFILQSPSQRLLLDFRGGESAMLVEDFSRIHITSPEAQR